MALTWKQRAHYILEIQELVSTLLRRLDELETASAAWVRITSSADAQLADESSMDMDEFAATMRAQVIEQSHFFDLLEGFLAPWARLSLILFPSAGKDSDAAFRSERGESLRSVLGVSHDNVFSDRELRNAWMHFDERLDAATLEGSFGDRQRFAAAADAKHHIASTLRLLEIDTLVVHYRGRNGKPRTADLASTRTPLMELAAAAAKGFNSY